MVKVNWREGKALGSEEGKTKRSEFFCCYGTEQRS
jgi:hypothetical protein